MPRSAGDSPASKSKPYFFSMCRRMSEESATISPSSAIYGSLPFGALGNPFASVSYGSSAILSSTSAFMTKGLASGRPKYGPKV